MPSKYNSRSSRKQGSKLHTSLCDTLRYYAIQQKQGHDLKLKEKGMRVTNTTSKLPKLLTLHSAVLATMNGVPS